MNSKVILATTMIFTFLGGCDAASGSADSKPAGPPITVTAAEISKAFQENEAKAKLAYDGKVLDVTGVVKDIDLSIGDTPVIHLKGAGDKLNMGVNDAGKLTDVDIGGLSTEAAAKINKGEKLTFTCSGGVEEALGSASLNDCVVKP